MGNAIRHGAAASDILRDVRLTASNAASRGSPYQEDAERFLEPVLSAEDDLASQLAKAEPDRMHARSDRDARSEACDDLIAATKDHLYNLIGRTAGDSWFRRNYPGGKGRYTDVPPPDKPHAIEQLCATLERVPHPKIPPEEITRATAAQRAAAAALAAANMRFGAAEARFRLLSGQVTVNAKIGAAQLGKLKRWWIIQGLSEHDIHQMIPDRPLRTSQTSPPGEGEVVELPMIEEEPEEEVQAAAK